MVSKTASLDPFLFSADRAPDSQAGLLAHGSWHAAPILVAASVRRRRTVATPSHPCGQWHAVACSPFTVAPPRRTHTAFPMKPDGTWGPSSLVKPLQRQMALGFIVPGGRPLSSTLRDVLSENGSLRVLRREVSKSALLHSVVFIERNQQFWCAIYLSQCEMRLINFLSGSKETSSQFQ
jgi:hypothetical protein